jgi:fructose-bisphosphate aldolase class II
VQAAEAKRSPLIILLFPSTVAQLPTLPFAAAAAVELASVPLSLHLDHAQDVNQIRTIAATMPFDSIMVDMSHHDRLENLALTKELAKICHDRGIAVEGEAGRINGGEEGIADTGELEGTGSPFKRFRYHVLTRHLLALLTNSEDVEDFIRSDVDILAPSIGNIHGDYGPEGPKLDYDRLASITSQINGRVEVALHGTNDFSTDVMKKCIERGAIKLNINKLILERWTEFFVGNASKLPLTELIQDGVSVLQSEVERWMDICGSSNRA